MGKYRGYEKYKESGVEWLGEIPEHWKRLSLRWLIQTNSGAFISNLDTEPEITHEAFIPVVGGNGIMSYTNKKNTMANSLVVGRVGAHCGNVHLFKENTWVTDNALLITIKPQSVHSDFLFWLLKSLNLNDSANKNAQPLITGEMIKSRLIAVPSLDEQELIAHFLDRKTSQIDALIAKKEALIEKLDEKRTALISHAVTKGLDPNVPMKDSGVEWLGEIPDHWNVKRLNFLAKRIGDGIHSTPEYVDNSEYHFINGNNLIKGKIVINDSTKCVSKEEFNKYNLNLDKRTLLLSINGTIGNVAFYKNEPVMLGKSAAYIVLNSDIEINFAYYFLLSQNTKNYFFDEVTGTTIFNLSLKSIKNIFFTHSSLEEQKTIARYLERKTSEIDQQKVKVKEAITLLKEYRTALITNAVTGKIDVRQVSTPRHKKSLLEVCAILEETHEDFPDVDENLLPLDDIEL
jgi:type I restriction enzyme, S subunit